MALKLGANSINKLYLGSTAINKAYLGATVLFSSGFDPVSLFAAGQEGVWYDPSDLTTLFQDSAEPPITPVTAAGQTVGTMLDKSGNGNHARQTTTAARPTYQTGSGLHWLEFDGIDDAMFTSAIDLTGTDKISLFIGQRNLANSTFNVIAEFSGQADLNPGTFLVGNSFSNNYQNYGSLIRGTIAREVISANSFTAPNSSLLTLLGDIAAPFVMFRINKSLVAENTSSLGNGNYGDHDLFIGARAGTGFHYNGRLYGMIIVGKTASTNELADVETYMAAKSGVTL
jgi:hypothetical protein